MQWSDVPRNPSRKVLRQFAALWLVAFLAIGAWQGLAKGRPTVGLALMALALTIGPLGLIAPNAVRPIFVGWMIAAFPIGWAVSQLILLVVYFVVVTPLGIALRLAGHDPLRLRRDPGATSYWAPRPRVADVRRYFRPY